MNTAGGSLKWFRDNLFGGETPENDAYDRINREIENEAKDPSKIIYLPYLSGERAPIWDPDARGTFIGLNTETTRAEMMRSIMEGTCFALQDNLEQAYKMGVPIEQLICCGGCTKSDIWLKIKASVIGREIVIPKVNQGATGGLGNMNAAYLGEYRTPEEACEANFQVKKIIEPVREWEETYARMYQIYKDSYQALKEQYKELAHL
jgi:sugar (pentulose or hexulose) kinase